MIFTNEYNFLWKKLLFTLCDDDDYWNVFILEWIRKDTLQANNELWNNCLKIIFFNIILWNLISILIKKRAFCLLQEFMEQRKAIHNFQ